MPKKIKLPHCGQILTTKSAICSHLWEIDYSVDRGLLYCIANGTNDPEYKTALYVTCSKLYFLSKLVYKSQHGIVKLPIKTYQQKLFIGYLETVGEVADMLGHMCIDKGRAAYVYKCLQPMELLLCNMIGCLYEQPFISELSYAVDYVIRREGEVEMPKFNRPTDLFPVNYKDFCYNEGIAKDIEKMEMES